MLLEAQNCRLCPIRASLDRSNLRPHSLVLTLEIADAPHQRVLVPISKAADHVLVRTWTSFSDHLRLLSGSFDERTT